MNIEGTITAGDFSKKVLFPYIKEYLVDYLFDNMMLPEVQQCFEDARTTIIKEEDVEPTNGEIIDKLQYWLAIQRHHPAIDCLRRRVWQLGYERNRYKTHVYQEVLQYLRHWRNSGLSMHTCDIMPVHVQKMMLKHTIYKDISHYFCNYFYTNKWNEGIFEEIKQNINIAPKQILFLSNNIRSLYAAKAGGLTVVQVARLGMNAHHIYPSVNSFEGINMERLLAI